MVGIGAVLSVQPQVAAWSRTMPLPLILYAAVSLLIEQALVCRCHRLMTGDDVIGHPASEKKHALPVRHHGLIQNLTVGLGDRAVFKCTIENLGSKTVTWRKLGDGHPLTIGHFPFAADTRMSVDSNQRTNEWSLIIQDVRTQDEGVYQCCLTVKDRQEFTNDIRLIVRTVQIEGTAYVEIGGTISLECSSVRRTNHQGVDQATSSSGLQWFHNGRRIETDISNGITITRVSTGQALTTSKLTIHSVDTSMSGDYVCKSSDDDLASTVVNVLDDFLMKRRAANKGISAERITGNHDRNEAVNQLSTRHHSTAILTLTFAFILNCFVEISRLFNFQESLL